MAINKKRILFLDDRSKRIMSAIDKWNKLNELTIVCTAKECIKKLSLQDWDYISLDHDLNFSEFESSKEANSGMEVVRYLCEHSGFFLHTDKKKLPTIVVHTANPAAGYEMVTRLTLYDFEAVYTRWQYGKYE